jgi:thiamine biosynthesis lipoprotein
MRLDRPHIRASLAIVLLAALAGAPTARAARSPAKTGRLAAATGPLLEDSRPLPGGELVVAAAGRAGLQDPDRARMAIAAALDSAARLAPELAAGAGGELARLNALAAAERFVCSTDLYAALDAALTVAVETDGAYDPTAAPLARLWERPRPGAEPDPLEVADARQLVGWRLLLLEPGNRMVRFRRPGMALALDAVAGGRVLQRAAAVMRERGIARARLELAGEVLAFTNHESWSVAVPHPKAGPGTTAMWLRVSNAAVATAGGAAGADLVDPRTGRRPGGEGSVTVVTAPAPGAPALAAALRVLGRDGAADYARRHTDVGVLWLEAAGDGLLAWAWNLDAVTAEPGLRVEWRRAR